MGLPLEDHRAAASVCTSFRDVITGPRFLALRKRCGRRSTASSSSRPSPLMGKQTTSRVFAWGTKVAARQALMTVEFYLASRRPTAVPGCLSAPSNRAPLPVKFWRWTSRLGDGDLRNRSGHGEACLYVSTSLRHGTGHNGLWEDLPNRCYGASGVPLFGNFSGDLATLQIYDIAARTVASR